jgi:hypothetical protein
MWVEHAPQRDSFGARQAGSWAAAALCLALFAWWATADGGYAPGAWYPGALLVLVGLVAVVRPAAVGALPRPARWALIALAAFTAWSFASIAWADARGDAWDGANRTLLYLTVFALFALVPWTVREAAAGLAAFAVVIAGVGAWAFARAWADADPSVFVDGRMAGPIGYENATAALFMMAFWAALLLAARPATPRAGRAMLLAVAGMLLDFTILAQSRGSLAAGLATLALALVLTRERLAVVVALLAVGAVTAAALPTLLGVYEEAADLTTAGIAIACSAAALLAAGLALGRVERWVAARRWTPRPHAVAVAALVLLAAGLVFAARGPDSRFASGPGSGRYDFWQVAALEFAHHPIAGVGADNFAHDYVRDRDRFEEPMYPHSLAVRAFSQLGIVGGGLLAAFLGAVALAVWRSRAAVAVAAVVAGAAWVVHGSLDWLWEMPAVGAPAMACLGLAAGLGAARREPSGTMSADDTASTRRDARRPAPTRRAISLGAAALAVVAALSYVFPALSARDVEAAVREWDDDPAGALDRLDRARDLNPLSDRPDLVAGALALSAGDQDRARRAYLAAIERDERNWQPHAVVALLDLEAGRTASAEAQLATARRLNPALGAAPPSLAELAARAIPGPIERRPVDCRPVLGLGADCR